MANQSSSDETLRQQVVTLRQIVEALPEAVVLLNREGRRVWQSGRYAMLLGLDPESLATSSSLAEVHPDDLPVVVEHFRTVLGGSRVSKIPLRAKDGEGRWVNLYLDALPHRDTHRNVDGIIGLLRPARPEPQPHVVLEELRPLATALLSHLSLAALQPPIHPEAAGHLREALLIAQDLQTLASPRRAVRGTASIPQIKPDRVAVAPILQELDAELIQPSAVARAEFDLLDTEAATMGVGRALRTMFRELFKNAVESMDRGVIGVEQRVIQVEPGDPLTFRQLAPGPFIAVHIRDQGCGMSEPVRNRIFEPSFTTKEGHAGMGLPRALEIARASGGTIVIHSQDRTSTCASVYLPCVNLNELNAQPKAAATPERKLRVLLMDDEPFVRDFAAAMLETLGYDVVATADGTEAIEQFSRAAMDDKHFDVVLLDLVVPKGVGGESTLTALRSMRDDFIAIASSGYADHPVMRDPRAHGFAACLPKPFRMEDLEQRMNRAKQMILG
ncbi:MAG: hypothetical protein OHK005_15600 [Candidatus Methylacidiphilales bacterium]